MNITVDTLPFWLKSCHRTQTSCSLTEIIQFPPQKESVEQNTKLVDWAMRNYIEHRPGMAYTVISCRESYPIGYSEKREELVKEMVRCGWMILNKYHGQYAEYPNYLMGYCNKLWTEPEAKDVPPVTEELKETAKETA